MCAPIRSLSHENMSPVLARITNLDIQMLGIVLKVPIVLETGWTWPSRSNLTSIQNYVNWHCFCVFDKFVRRRKMENFTSKWFRTYAGSDMLTKGSNHGMWNILVVYLVRSSLASASRRLGDWYWVLQAAISFHHFIHTSQAVNVYANIRQSPKQQ